MKFLLVAVNAKYIHSNPAIYSLRAYVGKALSSYVELAEYTINQSLQEILGDIYQRQPEVIGFSCYIWNWRLVRELAWELQKLLPETAIWLGGPEVSYDPEVILGNMPFLAGIMVGEGEETFQELLEYYVERSRGDEYSKDGEQRDKEMSEGVAGEGRSTQRLKGAPGDKHEKKLEEIRGLCLPAGFTPARSLVGMNSIPFLYHDLAPFEHKIIYYETSRGCPFRCSYCLSSIEKQVRLRDKNVIISELQFFLDNQVKQVKLVDRTFNCDHDHAMAVWQYLYEHDNNVTNFHFEISADILREDELELLGHFRPGLAQLEIGVQSTNPETLRAIHRSCDLEKLERNVARIREARNIHQHLDLIAGLPHEDYESFGVSFDRVYRMKPDQLQLGFLKVLKGSEMWERADEFGIQYLEQPPYEVLCTKWLSYEDILRLKRIEEMVEVYYNSAQYTRTMPFLEKVFGGPFVMYEALAEFYGEKGYFAASPARTHRYQILLEFAARVDEARLPAYRELLTCDLYLREKPKSRPEFAVELSGYKERIRDFYQKEERERRFLPGYEGYDWKQLGKMTHLEPFTYPVWDVERMTDEYEECGESRADSETRCFVLFDYAKRDPLNYEAFIQCLEYSEEEEWRGCGKAGRGEGLPGQEKEAADEAEDCRM